MLNQREILVAGVDGCKGGWFVAVARAMVSTSGGDISTGLKFNDFFMIRTFADVLSKTSDCDLVCVDAPIGLSEAGQRRCDLAARKILGRPRASSVFPAPIRACFSAKDHKTASQISFERTGKKLNKQSFFIMDKIGQIDELMTPQLQCRVREIHPEISFWALNSKKPMQHSKKKLAGRKERIELLSAIFPDVEEIVIRAHNFKGTASDDILDALVAAWTASQALLGNSQTLPNKPDVDSNDLRMEILCPVPLDTGRSCG